MVIFDSDEEGICAICMSKDDRTVEKMKLIRKDGENVLSVSICNDCKRQLSAELQGNIKQFHHCSKGE